VTGFVIFLFETSVRRKPYQVSIVQRFWMAQSFLGVLTYSLYVWHEPILLSLRTVFNPTLIMTDSIRYFPIGFGLTFLLAYVFYYYIEVPFQNKRAPQKASLEIRRFETNEIGKLESVH